MGKTTDIIVSVTMLYLKINTSIQYSSSDIFIHFDVLFFISNIVTYPIVVIASLFWQLPVQMDILSPFGLTLTTAPHTSSLASSKDSPIKHNSCKPHVKRLRICNIWKVKLISVGRPNTHLLFPSSSSLDHCVVAVY